MFCAFNQPDPVERADRNFSRIFHMIFTAAARGTVVGDFLYHPEIDSVGTFFYQHFHAGLFVYRFPAELYIVV
jgi:hypothetical protein